MTEKTVSTVTTAAPQAPAEKTAAPKAKVRKAPARKAPARKPRAHKTAPRKGVLDRFEGTVIAVPFKAANKTFMASLGLLSYVQSELDKQYKAFDEKFEKYARDGEKVFDKFEDRVEDFRKDVEKKVDEARERVRDTFNKAA